MGIKEQMIEILRSDEARRVRFSFSGGNGTVSVDRSTFDRVATALEDGTVSVVTGGARDGWAKYSARREGASAANTFYFGRNQRWSRIFNGLVLHECVHASFDLTRTTIPWLDNEAAAYIAQAYYLRNSGLARERLEFGSMPSIAYQYVNGLRSGNDSDVTFFLDALRNSLENSPDYHDYIRTTFEGDG